MGSINQAAACTPTRVGTFRRRSRSDPAAMIGSNRMTQRHCAAIWQSFEPLFCPKQSCYIELVNLTAELHSPQRRQVPLPQGQRPMRARELTKAQQTCPASLSRSSRVCVCVYDIGSNRKLFSPPPSLARPSTLVRPCKV